jgi:phosphoglycerate dehydrogenase-like enzyme
MQAPTALGSMNSSLWRSNKFSLVSHIAGISALMQRRAGKLLETKVKRQNAIGEPRARVAVRNLYTAHAEKRKKVAMSSMQIAPKKVNVR